MPPAPISARRARRRLAWLPAALTGAVVAAVELRHGVSPGRALPEGWMIAVIGALALRPAGGRPRPVPRRLALVSVAVAAVVAIAFAHGPDPAGWDWLYLSGVAALLVGVEAAEGMGARFTDTLRHLLDSGALRAPLREVGVFRRALRRRVRRTRLVCGALLGGVMLVAWLVVAAPRLGDFLTLNPAVIVFQSLAGVVAGQSLGRLVAFGFAWRMLHVADDSFVITPGHPDGAAGMRPIGRFYFQQSLVAAIPAVYLTAWWLAIPALAPDQLAWRPAYLALLAVAIVFEVLVFLLPMLRVHRLMTAWRRRFAAEADRLSASMGALRQALVSAADDHDVLSSRLAAAADWYTVLQSVPRWPVDAGLRRWFSLNNLGLFIPFLSYVFGNPEFWDSVGTVVGGLRH